MIPEFSDEQMRLAVEEIAGFGGWDRANPYRRRILATGSRFVYLMQAGRRGAVKVGIARRPFDRLDELQTGNPEQLRILHVEDHGSYARFVERDVHWCFERSRLHGEWFQIDPLISLCVSRLTWGEDLPGFVKSVRENEIPWDRILPLLGDGQAFQIGQAS
jgi:hypothetical protein